MIPRPVRRTRKGDFELHLGDAERDLLRSLAPHVKDLIGRGDPDASRLFPDPHPDDAEAGREYRRLVGDQLSTAHLAALATMEATVDAERLGEEELLAWMRALNEVRLVLGTRLDISEEGDERPVDDDDPRVGAFAAYDYITWLQGEAIDALGSSRR